jgi:hypothetical protein
MRAAAEIVDSLLDDESDSPKDFVGDRGVTIPTGTVTIVGSHGSMTVESATGHVLKLQDDGDDEENYRNIAVINLDEYRKWVEENNLGGWHQDGDTIDILFVGYWNKDGSYEEPSEEARYDYAADRKGQQPWTE